MKTPVKLTGVVKKASKERTLPDLLRKRSAAMIFYDEIVIRAPHYKDIVDMAKYSSAPVINAMADDENHPGQVLCDVFTMYEKVGKSSKAFMPRYQVNAELMKAAPARCKFMHYLPAVRGQEVTNDVIDSAQSIVFDEAENRLYTEETLLIAFIGERASLPTVERERRENKYVEEVGSLLQKFHAR